MAKKKKKEEFKPDGFVVLMTALGIILLAFFIILNVIAVPDESKTREALGSLVGSFGIMSGGLRAKENKGSALLQNAPPLVTPDNEMAVLLKALEGFADEKEGGGSLGFYGSKKGLVIAIGEKFAFKSGSAEIKSEAIPLLKKIAKALLRFESDFFVEGHTDNVPVRSARFRSNWELSTARAVNTLRFLTEKAGIPPEKMAAVGYGSTRPIVGNDTPEHKSMNRRVEIVIAKKRKKIL